jgi:glycerophosphoryl diester phosphodiesterase
MKNKIRLFCHRGLYGCTDVNQDFLKMPYAKGNELKNLPPENTYTSIKSAFDKGYGIELDVCMTKDNRIIVTHTNHLSMHTHNASASDYVSTCFFSDIKKMKTGMGGQTEAFLTYENFLDLFKNYPELPVNVEIKGTIEPQNALPPQTNPTIIEQLTKVTPDNIKNRIIWSSFSTETIINFKKLNPQSQIAQLFCEPNPKQPFIFQGLPDRYLQFNLSNVLQIFKTIPLEAVHVEISTLFDNDALQFCLDNHINIRTWSLLERNPEKDITARQNILNIFELTKKYPDLNVDIITDYAPTVARLLAK